MEFLNQVLNYSTPIFLILVQVIVCIGAFAGVSFVFKRLKDKNMSISDGLMTDIEILVIKVVKFLNQTIVNTLKENSPNGKLTEEEIDMLQKKSMEIIRSLLNEDHVQALISKFGLNYEDFLALMIEEAVVNEKGDLIDRFASIMNSTIPDTEKQSIQE